ncbi:DUF6053 domain-containing protein [Lysobacter enzymogenes]|uniref:DUF6053 domain-containing protein n=1 Tax=Lysobacter enzymogenes TaxID=69 RepID=UPI003CCD418E
MGGPSGPTLCAPIAATGNKSIGPEGPPTTVGPAATTSDAKAEAATGDTRPLAVAVGPVRPGSTGGPVIAVTGRGDPLAHAVAGRPARRPRSRFACLRSVIAP